MADTTPGTEYIALKWGTIKGWEDMSPASQAILQRWSDLGESMSCMAQNDTPGQKDLICELIDQLDGRIQNDWTGEFMTKEEAKDYIRNYRR